MKAASYVQRLFDRAGAAQLGAAAPTGPSASPLADADQRLNEPGFAGLFSLITPAAESAADEQTDVPSPRSVAPQRRRDADLAPPPRPRPVRDEPAQPTVPIASAVPQAPPAHDSGPPGVGRIAAEDFTPADALPVEPPSSPPDPTTGPAAAKPRPEPELERPSDPRRDEPPAPLVSPTEPPVRAGIVSPPDPAPTRPPPTVAGLAPLVAAEPASPAARNEEPGDSDEAPPRLAMPPLPSPRPVTGAEAPPAEPTAPPQRQREAPSARAEAAAPAREPEQQRQRPLTAAEASVIGPLTPEPRMRSLLGTRWR